MWTTKYRKRVLAEEAGSRVRELIREACRQHEVTIMKGQISRDPVHLFMSIPPKVTFGRLVQWLQGQEFASSPARVHLRSCTSRCNGSKGRSSPHLLAEFTPLRKQFWGRHRWARGYFRCSSGNVSDEVMAKYIEDQNEDQDDDFKVEGDG